MVFNLGVLGRCVLGAGMLGMVACAGSELGEEQNPGGDVAGAAKPSRSYELTAAPAQVTLHPRLEPTDVWAYNGQVPAPTLWAKAGEPFEIHFTNQLPQPTTIHFHGVRVPNAMDGVPGVTQPAVEPGGTFHYAFSPKDPGTFWYHPHVRGSEQVERGLQGVLIVEDPEYVPWSRDIAWVLDDWLVTAEGEIVEEFNTPGDLMHDGRWGNLITVSGMHEPVWEVKPGERIRLRLINTANGRVFAPDFGELTATTTAIAVDGMYAGAPFDPTGFYLAPGNRMDLDITIPADAAGRSYPLQNLFARTPHILATISVLDEAPVETPTFPTLANATFPEWPHAQVAEPNVTYRLNAKRGGEYGISWTINGDVYGEHEVAIFEEQEWVKVRYVNESFRLHPMHMHGVFFRVLARNGEPAMENHWRDTVLVAPEETVDVAMVPGERGKWALHCHILEHAEAGMMTVFEVVSASEEGASDHADAPTHDHGSDGPEPRDDDDEGSEHTHT